MEERGFDAAPVVTLVHLDGMELDALVTRMGDRNLILAWPVREAIVRTCGKGNVSRTGL